MCAQKRAGGAGRSGNTIAAISLSKQVGGPSLSSAQHAPPPPHLISVFSPPAQHTHVDEPREAEIGDLDAAGRAAGGRLSRDEHVGGLQVPMDDEARVEEVDPLQELPGERAQGKFRQRRRRLPEACARMPREDVLEVVLDVGEELRAQLRSGRC